MQKPEVLEPHTSGEEKEVEPEGCECGWRKSLLYFLKQIQETQARGRWDCWDIFLQDPGEQQVPSFMVRKLGGKGTVKAPAAG